MFKLPKLRTNATPQRIEEVSFSGINRREDADGRYFTSAMGMVSDNHPYVSSRGRNNIYKAPSGKKLLGLGMGKELYYVLNDGKVSEFYYGGELKGTWSDKQASPKHFAEVGKKICIFPDRAYFKPRDDELIERYMAMNSKVDGKVYKRAAQISDGNSALSAYNTKVLNYLIGDGWQEVDSDNWQEVDGGEVVVLKKGDVIKLWARDKDGNKVSFRGLPTETGIVMGSAASFRDYVLGYYDAGGSGGQYEVTVSSSTGEVYINLYMEFTYPMEYNEQFCRYLTTEAEFEIHRKDGADYLLLPYPMPNATGDELQSADINKQLLDGNLVSGVNVTFICEDYTAETVTGGVKKEVHIRNWLPKSAIVEEVGVTQFYHGNNTFYAAFLKFPENTFDIPGKFLYDAYDSKYKYTVFSGKRITLEFGLPQLSVITACNNRLWGFEGNKLYASALGQPFIFNDYSGNNADSYAVELNVDRNIEACISYSGVPHFFTRDRIIKVYGTSPSSYSTSETVCSSIASGGSQSLISSGGYLYFLDSDGNIARYDGTYPTVISHPLNESFNSCVSYCDSRFIYFNTDKGLFIYDTLFGVWMSDERKNISFVTAYGDKALASDGVFIYTQADLSAMLVDFTAFIEAGVKSSVEFPVFDEGYFGRKTINSLQLKIKAGRDTSLSVYIKQEDDGIWQCVYSKRADEGTEVYTIPIKTGRCLNFGVKIEAVGDWQFEGYSKLITAGSYKK